MSQSSCGSLEGTGIGPEGRRSLIRASDDPGPEDVDTEDDDSHAGETGEGAYRDDDDDEMVTTAFTTLTMTAFSP